MLTDENNDRRVLCGMKFHIGMRALVSLLRHRVHHVHHSPATTKMAIVFWQQIQQRMLSSFQPDEQNGIQFDDKQHPIDMADATLLLLLMIMTVLMRLVMTTSEIR
jgi:hypothetical protein